MAAKGPERSRVLNFNVGVLGHIDSGKTSLAKALSTVASTASFDKNPQSKERGITLDLGFSSFSVPLPSHLTSQGYEQVQFTLVDCPGHASLIRTIIGGAQIIDLMMLVVDITKGVQTQTAECLVIGEITCNHMIVVLNKVDLIEESKREAQIAKMSKRLSRTLDTTHFAGAPIIPVAAKPGGPEAPESENALGVDKLVEVLSRQLFVPSRSSDGPFIFSVDHCFPIRGQGTVMTGTVLSGSISTNDPIEIPFLKVTKKVKSMQMFHHPVPKASQGDRVGICVTQFDPKQVERCLVCSPGDLPTLTAAITKVFKIPYHKLPCATGTKFHVTIGHETIMAKTTFFGSDVVPPADGAGFDFSREFPYQETLMETGKITKTTDPPVASAASAVPDGNEGDDVVPKPVTQYALLEFEKPVTCPVHSLVIGSRLDTDAFSNTCRIAFHGQLVEPITDRDYERNILPRLRIFKLKSKEGVVDRLHDERTVIGRALFKKETKIQVFIGLRVQLSSGEVGTIEGAFGTTGKFRINIPDGLKPETIQVLSSSKKKGKTKAGEPVAAASSEHEHTSIKIALNFKRYVFDPEKRMIQ